jgi:hypothetical protein
MKKEIKYILFFILALVLAGLVYYLVITNQPVVRPAVVTVNKSDMISSVISTTTPATTTLAYNQEIKLELMSTEEKKLKKIDEKLNIQVLERDINGNVVAYRIITPEHPALDKYGFKK